MFRKNTPAIDGNVLLEQLTSFIKHCAYNNDTGLGNQKIVKNMIEQLAGIGFTYIPIVSTFSPEEFDFLFESVKPDISVTHENYSFLHALTLNTTNPALMDRVLHQNTINLKINPNFEKEPYGNTALHLLICNEIYENAYFLINSARNKKINIDYAVQDNEGKTTLILAAKMRAGAMVKFLLDNIPHDKLQSIVAIQDKEGNTALHYAMLLGDEQSADLLIKAGSNPNIKNNKGLSPLDLLQLKYNDFIQLTLKSVSIDAQRDEKAQLNIICHPGSIPITELTSSSAKPKMLQIPSLKSEEVEKALQALEKKHILHPLRIQTNTDNILMSVEEKKDLMKIYISFSGKSIQKACFEGRAKLRERHFIQEINPQQASNLKMQEISQKLRVAASKNDPNEIRRLHQQGADINGKSSNGNTSLHWAAQNGHESCYRLLLSLGADSKLNNKTGKTAEELMQDTLTTQLRAVHLS